MPPFSSANFIFILKRNLIVIHCFLSTFTYWLPYVTISCLHLFISLLQSSVSPFFFPISTVGFSSSTENRRNHMEKFHILCTPSLESYWYISFLSSLWMKYTLSYLKSTRSFGHWIPTFHANTSTLIHPISSLWHHQFPLLTGSFSPSYHYAKKNP